MAQRKRIALIFEIKKGWMGGTYYILNLINALNSLPDGEKPMLTLLVRRKADFEYAKDYTAYPHMDYRVAMNPTLNLPRRIINKLSRTVIGKNLLQVIPFSERVDAVYPIYATSMIVKNSPSLGWIPDFQELYLPQFFSQEELSARDRRARDLRDSGIPLVFSSEDSRNDYLKFYHGDKRRTHVFRFASRMPDIPADTYAVMAKYGVAPGKYYFCANQFWVHKNHRVLFEAVRLLRDSGHPVTLLCSGNNADYRSAGHYESLVAFIQENNLSGNIRLLGLIDRKEQLSLMKEARALIQPSLFEGWSTSIEEAKSMDKFMILSDLPLHKEQVKQNALFFKRDDARDLADKILGIEAAAPQVIPNNYPEAIREAGRTFMRIVSSLNDE